MKFGMDVMPLGTHTFQFPTLGNTDVADEQTCEVHCCVVGPSCTNVIQGNCRVIGHSCANVSEERLMGWLCLPVCLTAGFNYIVGQQWVQKLRLLEPIFAIMGPLIKLGANFIRGMLATVQFRIFCFPVCCLEM
jgi:hypothetical protein